VLEALGVDRLIGECGHTGALSVEGGHHLRDQGWMPKQDP
jgi:hypothetical protein